MKLQNDTVQVHAFVDGELDLAAHLEMEERLRAEPALRKRVDDLRQLRDTIREQASYQKAPPGLQQRLAALRTARLKAAPVRDPLTAPRRTLGAWAGQWLAWRPLVAATGMVAALAVAANLAWWQASKDEQTAGDVVASHVRSTLGEHLVDVASSDHHTVKPFLSARLGFSPPVAPLDVPGSVFVGGRVDYLDGRPVAALVYRAGQHIVNSFVWPASGGDSAPRFASDRGYLTAHWQARGMQHWVISDVNAEEFRQLVSAVQAAELPR